jgi:hypothetical protein
MTAQEEQAKLQAVGSFGEHAVSITRRMQTAAMQNPDVLADTVTDSGNRIRAPPAAPPVAAMQTTKHCFGLMMRHHFDSTQLTHVDTANDNTVPAVYKLEASASCVSVLEV